jgi:hypothetical protein
MNYKIKLVHILTRPEDERERRSIASLSPLQEFGIQYVQHTNAPHENPHLGCFLAHKRAITECFSDDLDFLLVCECDCVLKLRPEAFVRSLKHFCNIILNSGISALGIGSSGFDVIEKNGIYICRLMTAAHCVLYPRNKRDDIFHALATVPWLPYDVWLCKAFGITKSLAVTEKRLAIQADGFSIVDGYIKAFDWTTTGIGALPPEHSVVYNKDPEEYLRTIGVKPATKENSPILKRNSPL